MRLSFRSNWEIILAAAARIQAKPGSGGHSDANTATNHTKVACLEKAGLIGIRNKQFYFSLNKGGKTKLIYLGKKRVDRARQYSENYKKLLEIVEEMTILNMELIKEDACP